MTGVIQSFSTASPDSGPRTGLAGGVAYSSRLGDRRPSATSDSASLTAAATPSTTGRPSSALSVAARPVIPAQPSTITSHPSASRADTQALPTEAQAEGESRSRTGMSHAWTPAQAAANP